MVMLDFFVSFSMEGKNNYNLCFGLIAIQPTDKSKII